MNFTSLPFEMIVRIASFLALEDLAELLQVNKQLNEICTESSLWNAHLDNFIRLDPTCSLTAQNFTSLKQLKAFCYRVINRWSWVIGLWKRQIEDFGGLLHVKFQTEPYRIVGYDIQGNGMLEKVVSPVFTIDCDRFRDATFVPCREISCQFFQKKDHNCELIKAASSDEFVLNCNDDNAHCQRDMFRQFSETVQSNCIELTVHCLTALSNEGLRFHRIPNYSQNILCCQRSGVFAGEYSDHGTEVLSLHQSSSHELLLTKFSGDMNVPAGQVSISVDTSKMIDYPAFLRSLSLTGDNMADCGGLQSLMEQHFIDQSIGMEHGSEIRAMSHLLSQRYSHINWSEDLIKDESVVYAFPGSITLRQIGGPYFFYKVLNVFI